MTKPVHIARPSLPPLDELLPYLESIWESHQLTNGGPFHSKFEEELCRYLGIEHISLFANGTLALVTALQSLRIAGEVITSPFSFVATAHSLVWNGIRPVFVDIDPQSLNLDASKIEAAITPQTTAILPVHVYGRPCATDQIQSIADAYGLKVIYDAAHAFAVEDDAGSILRRGNLSILSFHATKVFTTFEGGAIVSADATSKQRIDYLKNFGFENEVTVVAPGINGKMNEFSAAVGLLQLRYIDEQLAARADVDRRYREALAGIAGIRCLPPVRLRRCNHSYFPILIGPEFPVSRDELYQRLNDVGICGRRYFYPLISDFSMYRGLPSAQEANLPVATKVARQVLCLPIYPGLDKSVPERVAQVCREYVQGAGESGG